MKSAGSLLLQETKFSICSRRAQSHHHHINFENEEGAQSTRLKISFIMVPHNLGRPKRRLFEIESTHEQPFVTFPSPFLSSRSSQPAQAARAVKTPPKSTDLAEVSVLRARKKFSCSRIHQSDHHLARSYLRDWCRRRSDGITSEDLARTLTVTWVVEAVADCRRCARRHELCGCVVVQVA